MRARLFGSGTPTRHLQVFAFALEATSMLSLIEQACGCSVLRGQGVLKVSARLSASGTPTMHLQVVILPLHQCRHEGTNDLEQACRCSVKRGRS